MEEEFSEDILSKELSKLNKITDDLKGIAKIMLDTYGLYSFDLYCSGILNRSLNLSYGFIDLIKASNFLSAAPLVRLNIDSFLGLFAAFQVEYNFDHFSEMVFKGASINKLKEVHRINAYFNR